MPIYEYQCDACSHKFEALQKVSDKLLVTCPECNKDALRKLVSAAGFQLKGTGWYVTDFRDKKPAGAKSTAKESSSDSGGSTDSSGSSDSKSSDSSSSKATGTD